MKRRPFHFGHTHHPTGPGPGRPIPFNDLVLVPVLKARDCLAKDVRHLVTMVSLVSFDVAKIYRVSVSRDVNLTILKSNLGSVGFRYGKTASHIDGVLGVGRN